jgi:nucleoside-diphosphate-sugar epimerase
LTLEDKTVLVTGATGFLGGTLAQRLAQDGVRVKALARSPQKGDFLRGIGNLEIVQGDITDAERMQQVIEGCDVVFHVAAALGGSLDDQRQVNVEGTRNVVMAAANTGIERIIHVSTIAVYGYRYNADITETTPVCPSAEPYSITKAEGESVVQAIAEQHDLSYTIVRPGMIYGARSNMWTRVMFRVARMKPTPFFGDGSGFVPAIHVDDLVDLICTMATHPAADGQIFNGTPDPAPTWREFLGAYAALAGHHRWLALPPALAYGATGAAALFSPAQSQRRALPEMARLMQKRITYKMTKARDLLGWQAQFDVHSGVEHCAPWLREQGLLP